MPSLTEEQAKPYITKLLTAMSTAGGSDLFVSKDFPPSMKLQGSMRPSTNQKLSGDVARDLAHALMNQRQREEFAKDLECNFAISLPGVARFRVNVFMQQQNVGMVIRTIANEIPDFAESHSRVGRGGIGGVKAVEHGGDRFQQCVIFLMERTGAGHDRGEPRSFRCRNAADVEMVNKRS
jgi:hypothetical protein